MIDGVPRLYGQVLDEADKPVSGAVVRLEPDNRVAITGALGNFTFAQLPQGAYVLRAKRGQLYSGPVNVVISDVTTEPITVRVKRHATLIVHVSGDGEPIVGADVTIGDAPDPERIWTVTTDASGTAVHHGVLPRGTARVVASGWVSQRVDSWTGEDPTGTMERFVALRRGRRVEGVVLGPDDQPVAGASVSFGDLADFEGVVAETIADANGAWRADLPVGWYSARASSDVFARGPRVSIAVKDLEPQGGVVLRVLRGGQLHGRILDSDGTPIADAVVTAYVRGEDRRQTISRGDGTFEVLGLRTEKYVVRARKGTLTSAEQTIDIVGDVSREIELVVRLSAITGTVVDALDHPLAGVIVSAGDEVSQPTDEQGQFEVSGLEPGEHVLRAEWPDAIAFETVRETGGVVKARTGDKGIKLVMHASGSITGRVMFEGAPLTYYAVRLAPSLPLRINSPQSVRTSDGRFEFAHVQPGTWGLVIVGEHTEAKEIGSIVVTAGRRVDLSDIVLARGRRIRGQVRDAQGLPVPGATVTIGQDLAKQAWTELGRCYAGIYSTTSDATGVYEFVGVAPRSRSELPLIRAFHPARGVSRAHPLGSDETVVDFVLSPTGAVDGVIEGFRGSAWIEAYRRPDPEPRLSHATSANAIGAFTLEGLPAGDYELIADSQEGTLTPVQVTVRANQRSNVRLQMSGSTITVTVLVRPTDVDSLMFARSTSHERGEFARLRLDDRVTYVVNPGTYHASVDRLSWTTVEISEQPAEQTVDLRPK